MTRQKLAAMSAAVHAYGGLWLAPAASGYDGRTLGGPGWWTTTTAALCCGACRIAFGSSPDGVALISWNEWSGTRTSSRGRSTASGSSSGSSTSCWTAVRASPGLSEADADRKDPPAAGAPPHAAAGGPAGADSGWTGARAALALGLISLAAVPGLSLLGRRRAGGPGSRRRHRTPGPDSGEGSRAAA